MNRQPSILIVNNNLELGGIQTALVNLLKEISDTCSVTLFLFSNTGPLKDEIPKSVRVTEAKGMLRLLGLSQAQSRALGTKSFLARAMFALLCRIFGNRFPIKFLIGNTALPGRYDLAVSFMQNSAPNLFYGGCNEFVINCVDAGKKAAFLHCDFASYEGNTPYNRALYARFDKIAAVSKSCAYQAAQAMPSLKKRICTVENCYDFDKIKAAAQKSPYVYDRAYFNVLTIARLSPEKGILRAAQAVASLVKSGYPLRWHLVGDGPDAEKMKQFVLEHALGDAIFLHGAKKNPYRYLTGADLFLLPSFHEGAPMVFGEAACLGVPILATATSSAKELVEKRGVGMVCENSEMGILKALKQVLDNPEMLYDFANAGAQGCTNQQAVASFFSLLDT